MRLAARLTKLEATQPSLPVPVEQRPRVDWVQLMNDIKAESDRVAALPPKAKLAHHREYIASKQRKAALPPRAGMTNLSGKLHACLIQDVRRDFPELRHEMRQLEILLLRETGYPTADLEAQHRQYDSLPWQWPRDPLPLDAQVIVDKLMFDERHPMVAEITSIDT